VRTRPKSSAVLMARFKSLWRTDAAVFRDLTGFT
jgi:hypothetical protein